MTFSSCYSIVTFTNHCKGDPSTVFMNNFEQAPGHTRCVKYSVCLQVCKLSQAWY